MKKRMTAFFASLSALTILAQYNTTPGVSSPGITVPAGNNLLRNGFGAGTRQWSNQRANAFTGYEFEEGAINQTFGGSSEFSRGTSGATTLYINGNMTGYFAAAVNNSGALASSSTAIIADPDVTIRGSKQIVMLRDNNTNNNNSLGTWSFTGGTYISSTDAFYARNIVKMTLDSTSVQAGGSGSTAVYVSQGSIDVRNSRGRTDMAFEASRAGTTAGAGLYAGAGTVDIEGDNISFIASQGRSFLSDSNLGDNISGRVAGATGMAGLIGGTVNIDGGNLTFLGGAEGGTAVAAGTDARAYAWGAHGAQTTGGTGTMSNSFFKATTGGSAEIELSRYIIASDTYTNTATSARAIAHGGTGLLSGSGNRTLINTEAYGASGGSATANYENNYADASGGHGVHTTGSLTIEGGKYVGGQGGSANAPNGEAYAYGGHGIFAAGNNATTTINGGEFKGGRSGRVEGKTFADGAAVRQLGGALVINGGTFDRGGSSQGSIIHGNALVLQETDLTVSEGFAETEINGNILLINDNAASATFNAGNINGDIIKIGSGATALSISNAASYTGSFIQDGGSVNVTLGDASEGEFFSKVSIYDGNMTFGGTTNLVTKEGSVFNFYSTNNNTLAFNNGATLSKGTKVNAGFNTVSSTGDLNLEANSEISVSYDAVAGLEGTIAVTGGDLNFDAGSKFTFEGIADVETGSKQIVTADNVGYTGDIHEFIDVDFGWLTAIDTNATSTAGGITVAWNYNSLTNSSLSDLDTAALEYVDSVILSTNVDFYSVNAMGEKDGTKLVRYGVSQIPDVSEASFQVNQQLTEQIAARGTEFRSMNGFASTKPTFGKTPTGVAGPQSEEEKTMQGWVRVYGGKGSRDASGDFSDYDSSSWGTVIGIDKSFGNLLVGLAGGFARTDLDANAAYQADVDTYHGSLYSTFGGESLFVDLAFTYGWASTEEENELAGNGEFDSQIYSFYLGAGYAFDLGNKLAITPEASLLASFYDQESYTRVGGLLGDPTVSEYDTSSYLGSIGATLATQHQIDWLNRGIAYIPEVRAHYIHEFNADPDDFTYIIGGNPTPFAVRPRDESLFRVGLGLDMWSWKYQSSKFEIDYDALFSDTYFEHIVSGKVSWRF